MRAGDYALARKGTWAKVISISAVEGERTVYNFEVASNHDYFVGTSGELVHNGCEVFFRSMTAADYDALLATGKLSPGSETFISSSEAYAAEYGGVLVRFEMQEGTTSALAEIGVGDFSHNVKSAFPNMPPVETGWMRTNAFFKGEGELINIGLGYGQVLDLFNSMVTSITRIR